MREQLDLLGYRRREQAENLARVRGRIGRLVVEFCQDRMDRGARHFHMDDLRTFIYQRAGAAPDSPSRILRALRAEGQINYRVASRAESLYEVVEVKGKAA